MVLVSILMGHLIGICNTRNLVPKFSSILLQFLKEDLIVDIDSACQGQKGVMRKG